MLRSPWDLAVGLNSPEFCCLGAPFTPIRDTKGLYLHLPSGAEVRGLDLSTLVTLLQALA